MQRKNPKPIGMKASDVVSLGGGSTAVGEMLGISKQSVHNWEYIPAIRVVDMAAITGLAPEKIRPDVFRNPKTKPAKKLRRAS